MKRNYSYFIIKPDGIRFFDKIHQKFKDNFQEIRYFRIEDFERVIKKLYFRHYENKGNKFADSFEQYLYASKSIFGNEALFAIVADQSKEDYESFRKKVYDVKVSIREDFENPNVSLFSNQNNNVLANYVKIISPNGEEMKQIYSGKKGNYRISKLNVIHCPDSDLQSTFEELKILCDEGVINENNLLGVQSIEELLRFKTITGYQVNDKEHKPNISSFVVNDIMEQLK